MQILFVSSLKILFSQIETIQYQFKIWRFPLFQHKSWMAGNHNQSLSFNSTLMVGNR